MNQRHIFSEPIDTVLVGGLAFLFFAVLIIGSHAIPTELILWESLTLTVLINGPHFMASYRLLYASRETVTKYRAASLYIPAALVTYAVVSLVWMTVWNDVTLLNALLLFTGLYLALHYTGQAWGMMSSFAFLQKTPFDSIERAGFKTCLQLLAVWQVGWALHTYSRSSSWHGILVSVMPFLHGMAVLTALAGVVLFFRFSKRHRCLPTASIWVPFFLLHLWYIVLWAHPQAIFWVQISHALQYLSFPARVEFNRLAQEHSGPTLRREEVKYLLFMICTSVMVFYVVPYCIDSSNPSKNPYWVAIAAVVNIHHYFIDGCVWHIRNPEVRKQLFAHVS